MDKRFLGILAAIVVVLVGIFIISSNSGGSGSSSASPTNHVEGKGASGVTLVEYGDYQCPVCEEYYQAVQQVEQKYADKLYFQFRNLPLTSLHPNAFSAARAAEAAATQGKFWQMHDLLYQNQVEGSGWTASTNALEDYYVKYAQQIGLNISQFRQDYASDKVNSSINADVAAFNKTGQPEATPTFFLDGKVLDNVNLGVPSNIPGRLNVTATVANFAKVIDAEIAQKANTKH